jgi:hypothetical protein
MSPTPIESSPTQLRYELDYHSTMSNTETLCGTITFALRYDFVHRVMMVHVLRCHNLINSVSAFAKLK